MGGKPRAKKTGPVKPTLQQRLNDADEESRDQAARARAAEYEVTTLKQQVASLTNERNQLIKDAETLQENRESVMHARILTDQELDLLIRAAQLGPPPYVAPRPDIGLLGPPFGIMLSQPPSRRATQSNSITARIHVELQRRGLLA